ncbi:MAG: sulfotransferase [Alphaproteobacteria bacterium]|nr:sulfotransferase [Alphaproteobacteria bacterium]
MHPLFGADASTLWCLLRHSGPVSPAHLPSLALAGLSMVARTPFGLGERAYVACRRRHQPPMPPPIFIIGHWRSGTTHLYNIMSKGDFGYVSPFAAGMPREFQTLGRWLRPLLGKLLPETRHVDQVAVGPDSPQEDEIPLGSMSPISFYHGIYFPRHFERHLNRSLFLEGCTSEDIAAWESAFRHFMEKLWLDQGKRLLIKNPTYSARIPQLRRIFPDARFIHIYRNPHAVFRSTRRFYQTLIDIYAWQTVDRLDLDRLVLESYRRMMEKIDRDKQTLPEGHFVDLRFEDLEAEPLCQIERLYHELDLGEFRPWRQRFERYLASVEGFEKTFIPEMPDDRIMVESHCQDLLDRFGYAALGS